MTLWLEALLVWGMRCAASPTPLDRFSVRGLLLILGLLTRSCMRLEEGKSEEVVS